MPLEMRRCADCRTEFEVLVTRGIETPMSDAVDGCAHERWTRLVKQRPARRAASNEAGFAHYNPALGMHIEDRAQYKRELERRGLVAIDLDENEDTDNATPSTQREHERRSDDAYAEYLAYQERCDHDPEYRRAIAEAERRR